MTQAASDPVDEAWRTVAEAARECLAIMDYPVTMKRCLPGEAERGDCGGSCAQHVVAYFATLGATIDHQLVHLSMPGARDIYERVYAQAEADIACPH